MARLKRGYIQIYTGNGKGKTTAAIGQAVRAAGHGLRTFIMQFMKNYPYGEHQGLKPLEGLITIRAVGDDRFVFQKKPPSPEDIALTHAGLEEARTAMLSGDYDIIVLDEICVSIYFGLFTDAEVIEFLRQKPAPVELILTGRYCPESLIELADLVTEMREVKHYYQQGILARKGIES